MKEIYRQFHGKMVKVNEPTRPDRPNFIIRWNGKDWSGYRTLIECERQFNEIESPIAADDPYTVVEDC